MNLWLRVCDWTAMLVATIVICVPIGAAETPSGTNTATNYHQQNRRDEPAGWFSNHITDVLLIAVGALQALVLFRQARIADRQVDVAREQARIVERQVQLEERRFAEELRAKVTVRKVAFLEADNAIIVRFGVFNRGSTTARVGAITSSLVIYPGDRPGAADRANAAGFEILAGESRECRLEFAAVMKQAHDSRRNAATSEFHCIIHYMSNGSSRRYVTEFNRVAQGVAAAFDKTGNSDDNYED